jgi:hypothetical protein
VRLHHKTGVVEAGEDIVFVVILAGHRGEAFSAVQDGINRLKGDRRRGVLGPRAGVILPAVSNADNSSPRSGEYSRARTAGSVTKAARTAARCDRDSRSRR